MSSLSGGPDSLSLCLRVVIGLGIAMLASAACGAQGAAAIASPDRYGADSAVEILRAGGNAVDAAVATAFTLAVTYPEAGNLGGGGFATLFVDGQPYFLDYRECAPATARAGMYLNAAGEVIPEASTVGSGAAGVPGTVAGLWELHHRFGRLPWQADLAPAIRFAQRGFYVEPLLVDRRDQWAAAHPRRTNFLSYFGALAVGRNFRQPDLAATLRRIAAAGSREFYAGHTADLIIAEMRLSHGHIQAADLRGYRPIWRDPLQGSWAGYSVITAPPPGAGGITLLSMLAMKADLADKFAGVPLNSAQYVHLLAEIEKRVYSDRGSYIGDPAFQAVPVAQLLDSGYLARRAAEVNPDHPTPIKDVRPGLADHHDTTHLSVVDSWGNAVSTTITLNDFFGSGQVVRGAGFLLNDEMDDFSAKPGTPNGLGLVSGDANAIAPGKRPVSGMTPTILTQHGRVVLVIGTPGGGSVPPAIFQVLTNWHDFDMPLAAAVAEPRLHNQLYPVDSIFEEPYAKVAPAVRSALISRGYKLVNQAFNGDIEAIELRESGAIAVADPRGRGVARVLAPSTGGNKLSIPERGVQRPKQIVERTAAN